MSGDGYGSVQKVPTEEVDGIPFGEEPPKRPGINPCLWLFHLIEALNAIVAGLLTLTQILPFFFVRAKDWSHKLGLSSMILRFYISIFCVLVAVTEFNAPIPIIRESALLQNYVSRGFLYSFVGIISVQEANNERVQAMFSHSDSSVHVLWLAIFMSITSWMMIGAGLLYLAMGILCLKPLRDRMRAAETEAWRSYREELSEWKSKSKSKK